MNQIAMYSAKTNSLATALSVNIDNSVTTIPVLDASKLPTAPNLVTIGTDEGAETILYTGISCNDLTGVTRGFQGTAKSWDGGTTVRRNFTAYDHDTFKSNIDDLNANKQNVLGYIPVNKAGDTMTGVLGVTKSAGVILNLKKSSVFTGEFYIDFKDSSNTEIAYIGYGSGTNDNFHLANNVAGADLVLITNGGNVSTTSPLKILTGAGSRLIIEDPTTDFPAFSLGRKIGQPSIKSTSTWLIEDSSGAGTGGVSLNHFCSDNVFLGYGGGNVGIGAITPNIKFDINGDSRLRSSYAQRFGGVAASDYKYSIQYNAADNSLDFVYS